jgi:hypothetical protein
MSATTASLPTPSIRWRKFGGPNPRYAHIAPYARQLGVVYAYGGRAELMPSGF